MPTYEYACKSCGKHLEVHQSFTDDALTTCPSCQGQLRKVFASVGIAFKGSGFYSTDNRPKKNGNGSGEGSEKTGSEKTGSEKAGSEKTSSGEGKDGAKSGSGSPGSGDSGSSGGSGSGGSGGSGSSGSSTSKPAEKAKAAAS